MQEVVFQIRINDSKTTFILYSRLQAKTTRCFEENDGLFLGKRRVVWEELWVDWRRTFQQSFYGFVFQRIMQTLWHLWQQKSKNPCRARAYARGRESFIIVMATDSDNKYQNLFFLYFIAKIFTETLSTYTFPQYYQSVGFRHFQILAKHFWEVAQSVVFYFQWLMVRT